MRISHLIVYTRTFNQSKFYFQYIFYHSMFPLWILTLLANPPKKAPSCAGVKARKLSALSPVRASSPPQVRRSSRSLHGPLRRVVIGASALLSTVALGLCGCLGDSPLHRQEGPVARRGEDGGRSYKLLQRRAVSLLNVCQLRCARRLPPLYWPGTMERKSKLSAPSTLPLTHFKGADRRRREMLRRRRRERLRGCLCTSGHKLFSFVFFFFLTMRAC